MLTTALLLFTLQQAPAGAAPAAAGLEYKLRVDSADLSGVSVELRVRDAAARLQVAAHAHPEYDDRYWRYVEGLTATDSRGAPLTVSREDSVLWRVNNGAGDVVLQYRVRFPVEGPPRASWRPFLAPTGGLVGGPHSFLYAVGRENSPVTLTLELPSSWQIASGLSGPRTAPRFTAADVHTLMESPLLVGALRQWTFRVRDVPHRVVYWPLPDATPFDTLEFVRGIERLTAQAFQLFGSAPYDEYTFLFQDGAYGGGLEHPNSATLGAQSAELARDPHAVLPETAHEFVHTWNLMAIRPAEYREVDYRVQPPVAGLWFSEGVTMLYADLLLRRAGLPTDDSTRVAHLAALIQRYLSAPGNLRFSAEDVSRVAYNAAPDALGDYTASAHLQGELIGTVIDLLVLDATDGARSLDDVMRLMYARFSGRGFTGSDVQSAVEEVCSCSAAGIFDRYVRNAGSIDFDRYLRSIGLRVRTTLVRATGNDGQPLRDLRIWGWQGGEPFVRLRLSDPNSIWGRAGLRTGDRLVSINGAPVRTWPELRAFLVGFALGDSASIVVARPTGQFEARVVMQGFERPDVIIEPDADASERQRRLRARWLESR